MVQRIKMYLIFAVPLCMIGCGRKNNSFLNFEKKEKVIKVNRLTLPSVKNITLSQNQNGTHFLQWTPVASKNTQRILVGYNIYRFIQTAFIPRKPLNKQPIKENFYHDTTLHGSKTKKIICYVVRSVFKIKGKKFEGPLSNIVCTNVKNPPT